MCGSHDHFGLKLIRVWQNCFNAKKLKVLVLIVKNKNSNTPLRIALKDGTFGTKNPKFFKI